MKTGVLGKLLMLIGAVSVLYAIYYKVYTMVFLRGMVKQVGALARDASAIGIIGGADGPTAVFLSKRISPAESIRQLVMRITRSGLLGGFAAFIRKIVR